MVAQEIPDQPTLDDENGNCRQCGHPFNPHIITAYDVEDFSKGGEMRCQVEECPCFSTVSFDFSGPEQLPNLASNS